MPASPLVFLGRQPILDLKQALHGYQVTVVSGTGNTLDLEQAYTDLHLGTALQDQLGFIPLNGEPLRTAPLQSLVPQLTVLEINSQDLLDAGMKPRLAELKQRGFQFAVQAGADDASRIDELASLAEYVKLDTQAIPRAALEPLVAAFRRPAWKLIATGVESPDTKKWCESQGFHYLQGYYFSRDLPADGRKLDSSATGLLKLINLLNSDAELPALESAFKAEPALTVNLLRLVNSVGMGNRVPVSSLRHAISALGQRQLLRWLQLLMFSSRNNGDGMERNPLMQQAALRGYFMEQLAGVLASGNRELQEQAFLTGLLSLVPVALGTPLPQLLEKITVGDDVRDALLSGGGKLGNLLSLAVAYDGGDPNKAMNLLAAIPPIDLTAASRCLAQGLAWIRQLTAEASG